MNAPKLRFKEFNDEWLKKELREISQIYDGTHQTPDYIQNGVPFVSVEDISDIEKTNKFISKNAFEKEFKIKPQVNDILMTRITAGIIGATAIVKNNGPLGYYVSLALIRKNKEIDVNYLNQYINCFKFKKELNKRIIHVAFPKKINLRDIGKCKISITSINEQQKIGKTLLLLDKKIELQSKKIEGLKLFKKSLILDKKNNVNNWYEYKISDILNITRGIVISKNDINANMDDEHIYPVYSSQTSNDGILGYDDNYDFDGKYLTWTTDGANAGKVFYRNGKFRCTNVCGVLYNKNNEFVNILTAELLNIETPRHVSYVGNPKLMNNVMADIKVKLPPKSEERVISGFLTIINNKIFYENLKLSKIIKLKKGLMQSMFV